ncbi:MAG: exodeoxyribonuclease III [Chitinivibrionales bacterium]|nr:exodeoxyribonuclease III [Chitinivibrionales bacterium]MBD3395949.1 exodeoxyribonuclease III [Chitinivibrionales bacterium]
MVTIASWNVNGIRAASGKGMLDWLAAYGPDILCVQETKAHPEQLTNAVHAPRGYASLWESAEKRGYSGVAAYVKKQPLRVKNLGVAEFDREGRTQILEYDAFTLVNAYFPNSQDAGARLGYKLDFCAAMLKKCRAIRKNGKNLVICGDFNIAHTEIDLANPKQNEKNAGYLPEERAWMTRFLKAGYTDTFRMFTREGGHYTWWSYRFHARAKGIGWRIDYFCVNSEFAGAIRESTILKDVTGSDHCPIVLKLNV